MKQTTKRLVGMLVSLTFLIAAFIVYFDVVSPAYGDMQALRGKAASEQNILLQEASTTQQVQQLVASYKSESQTAGTVALALPSEEDISGALNQIYGIAGTNNINILTMNIALAPVIASSTTEMDVSAPSIVKPLDSISFAIEANGSYEDFKNFLSELETNIRIFDMKNISIQPAQSAPQNAANNQDNFNYELTIVAYYQMP